MDESSWVYILMLTIDFVLDDIGNVTSKIINVYNKDQYFTDQSIL